MSKTAPEPLDVYAHEHSDSNHVRLVDFAFEQRRKPVEQQLPSPEWAASWDFVIQAFLCEHDFSYVVKHAPDQELAKRLIPLLAGVHRAITQKLMENVEDNARYQMKRLNTSTEIFPDPDPPFIYNGSWPWTLRR